MKLCGSFLSCAVFGGALLSAGSLSAQQVITGSAAFADWSQQKPGVLRKITAADLPAPFATESTDNVLTREGRVGKKKRFLSIPYGMAMTVTPSGFHMQGRSDRP